jgi:hypothetical protein
MDAIATLRREIRRQFRALHEAVARDHSQHVSGCYAATGETDALADAFEVALPTLAMEATQHAHALGALATLEPIIDAVLENQRRLYVTAREAVFDHVPGLPQVVDGFFPAIERLDRAMLSVTAPPPANELAECEHALTASELRVLQALAETPHMAVVQHDICARTDGDSPGTAPLSRATVGRILARLLDAGMVAQPRGVRAGWQITPAGQEKIAH